MKQLTIILILAFAATGAFAQTQTVGYGWEDGIGTVHGTSGNVGGTTNVTDFVNSGSHALYGTEDPVSGTPELWVAWIHGLQDGDEVTVSLYVYDDTPLASPSVRLWGHWSNDDYLDDNGSAGGDGDYPAGTGWEQMTHTWTFDADGGNHTGMMVQARLYTDSAATPPEGFWVDDIEVTCPDYCQVFFPDGIPVPNGESTWGSVKNLYR